MPSEATRKRLRSQAQKSRKKEIPTTYHYLSLLTTTYHYLTRLEPPETRAIASKAVRKWLGAEISIGITESVLPSPSHDARWHRESEGQIGPWQDCKLPKTCQPIAQQRQQGILCEAMRRSPRTGKRPALNRLNATLNVRKRHPVPQPPADRRESGVCESRGEAAGTGIKSQ